MTSDFPSKNEKGLLDNVKEMLDVSKVHFTKQNFPRGIKFHGKCGYNRITVHVCNVEDVKGKDIQ